MRNRILVIGKASLEGSKSDLFCCHNLLQIQENGSQCETESFEVWVGCGLIETERFTGRAGQTSKKSVNVDRCNIFLSHGKGSPCETEFWSSARHRERAGKAIFLVALTFLQIQ